MCRTFHIIILFVMPPKRGTSSSGKARKARKPAPDWRETLFYWRGKITDELHWSGTWCAGTDVDGLPSDADFGASLNSFSLVANEPIGMLLLIEDAQEGAFVSGTYKLDNGGGLADYADLSHNIHVDGPFGEPEWCIVGARGSTEFGEFVSLGRLDRSDDGGHMLTLARRYISASDPRCKMTAAQIASRVGKGGPEVPSAPHTPDVHLACPLSARAG